MRSIRRSLTAYLLVLTAATLAVVGFVIDTFTGKALAARERSAVELIDRQFDDRCRDERQRVDDALFQQARELGYVLQAEYLPQRFREDNNRFRQALPLAAFAHSVNPLAAAGLASANGQGRLYWRLFREHFSHLPLDDSILKYQDDEGKSHDLFQVNNLSQTWRSSSLEGQSVPFDPKAADAAWPAGKIVDWRHDDVALVPSGTLVRRAVVKMPLVVNLGFGGGGPRDRRRPPGSDRPPAGPPPPAPPVTGDLLPKIYVQCARPVAAIDATIDGFKRDRDAQVATAAADARVEREGLRIRLGLLGLGALAGLIVGGPLLISRGLFPLRRLSAAVSQVSEKDFRLPHDGDGLPRELTAIHARLSRTLDQLREAFAREKQAVADISHELRTPIASLQATLDVALRKPRTPEQYKATLEDCRLINKQLGQLVERIMTLASLDAGNDRTRAVRGDAAELIAECAAVVRPLAAALDLQLVARVDDPLELDTDPDKLREVVMNLLHNAVEYNRPGGRVDVSGRVDGGRVVIDVTDTGIGMTAAIKDRIFERFYRADPSRHATGVHAGLGLAIVTEYVGRLGGTIAVSSVPGEGSRFTLSLPAAQDAEPTRADAADALPAWWRPDRGWTACRPAAAVERV